MKIFKIYEVGGCVRDRLLGIKSNDIDYAFEFSQEFSSQFTTISPNMFYERMNEILHSEGYEIFLETPDCFTTRARFPKGHQHQGVTADFVMCRKETYDDPQSRHPTVQIGTLYDDLLRRDFTVNAIAEDEEGNLIDPFDGQGDLKSMILRCPIDAETSFMDDPLRMIRALRFMVTKGFRINGDISQAMLNQEIWKKFDQVISRERVREELFKMFTYNTVESLNILNLYISKYHLNKYLLKDDIWFKPTLIK